MADIPVIPGVKVSTKGILNKPIKDIICALLFGGINNMLKGPLLCVTADIDALLQDNFPGTPSLADLKNELKEVKDQLKAFEEVSGIKDILDRTNKAIAEVQSLLALDGMCAIPLKAPAIPDVLGQVIDAEFAEANAILNDLGRLSKPQLCLNGDGGINTGTYNSDSILGSIQKHLNRMEDIPSQKLDALKKRLQGVSKALKKSINRQLFPDFRHKHDLTTGRPWVAGGGPALAPPPPPDVIASLDRTPADYPPPDAPNLKDATAQAQSLVAGLNKTASYPAKVDGIVSNNIWAGILGPDVYTLAVNALTPQDPFFAQQDPIYDYCGKFIGYTSTVVSGEEIAVGKDPAIDANPNPPVTNFNILWIADRNCWAVNGVQSEQIINGRKDVYLDRCPEIELHRGYNHLLSIPSADISGFTWNNDIIDPASVAPELFICYVDYINGELTPRKNNGIVVPFNNGLSRLETYELLEDANGLFDNTEAYKRKTETLDQFGMPLTSTTLYFAAETKVYSGTEPPKYPSESVWWYNINTCVAQKWVLNRVTDQATGEVSIDGTGTWVEVTNDEREARWVGSSNIANDPHVNYLAYSNKDGTVFGLLKLV
jgi:hypothetical protein